VTDGATNLRVAMKVPWPDPKKHPYIRHLCDGLEARGIDVRFGSSGADDDVDIVHLQWPDAAFDQRGAAHTLRRATKVLRDCLRWRRRGAHVVWTAHNLCQHERLHPRLEPIFWRMFVRVIDGAIFLSEPSRKLAQAQWPRLGRVAQSVIFHGHFRDSYPALPSRHAARRQYGIPDSETVLLYFGHVRPYKNVPHLIEVFRRSEAAGTHLMVAGRPLNDDYAARVRAAAADDDRITLALRHIANDEVPRLFAAADMVVLPFSSILNSGSVMLSLSLDRPVLVPHTESLSWMRDLIGPEWMHEFDGPLNDEHLSKALSAPSPSSRPDLDAFSWTRVVDQTVETYQSLTLGTKRHTAVSEP
jgi:glycosyltransferase involved in cell wall biosynthesis